MSVRACSVCSGSPKTTCALCGAGERTEAAPAAYERATAELREALRDARAVRVATPAETPATLRRERDEARALLSVARGLAEEAGIEAKVMREQRDTLAAALAEVRDAVAAHREAMRYAREDGALEAWGTRAKAITDAYERVTRALSALPADLAAKRDARVRAEALREAAERVRIAVTVHNRISAGAWLHARADETEKGGAW